MRRGRRAVATRKGRSAQARRRGIVKTGRRCAGTSWARPGARRRTPPSDRPRDAAADADGLDQPTARRTGALHPGRRCDNQAQPRPATSGPGRLRRFGPVHGPPPYRTRVVTSARPDDLAPGRVRPPADVERGLKETDSTAHRPAWRAELCMVEVKHSPGLKQPMRRGVGEQNGRAREVARQRLAQRR